MTDDEPPHPREVMADLEDQLFDLCISIEHHGDAEEWGLALRLFQGWAHLLRQVRSDIDDEVDAPGPLLSFVTSGPWVALESTPNPEDIDGEGP